MSMSQIIDGSIDRNFGSIKIGQEQTFIMSIKPRLRVSRAKVSISDTSPADIRNLSGDLHSRSIYDVG